MDGSVFVSHRAALCAGLLCAALALPGCSSDGGEETASTIVPVQTAETETTAPDRAQLVYDAYFRHCKEFTYQALAFPRTATDATDAARQYAGPPRRYQQNAFRGCLDGLKLGTPRITLADIKRTAAEEAKEHGDG